MQFQALRFYACFFQQFRTFRQNKHRYMSLKHLFLSITIILSGILPALGQTVFATQYSSDAQVKVYVSKYKSDADLVVYKAQYKSDAEGDNKGIWYFCQYSSEAKKKIYFAQYKSDADLVIWFTDYKSEAGWQKKSKEQLMY